MSDDLTLCVEILEKAIAFEEEGMAFFQDRAEHAPTTFERNLFNSLAKDEAGHKAYLVQHPRGPAARADTSTSLPDVGDDHVADVRRIFEPRWRRAHDPYDYQPEELEILKGAMDVERKGYAHVRRRRGRGQARAGASGIFAHLAAEEQNHYALLKNTYDYMADPEGFDGFDGSPMLDGG